MIEETAVMTLARYLRKQRQLLKKLQRQQCRTKFPYDQLAIQEDRNGPDITDEGERLTLAR